MKPILTTGGVYIPYKDLDYAQIEKIKKIFTIEYSGYKNSVSIARGYKDYVKKQTLCVPKFAIFDIIDNKDRKDDRAIFKRAKINLKNIIYRPRIKNIKCANITWKGRLKSYQELIVNDIFSDYYSDACRSGLILKLPTGHGKTFVAMSIISRLKTPTLIICPRCSIAKQWIAILTDMFPKIVIGSYFTGSKIYSDSIMVSVIDSLSSSKVFKFKNKKEIKYVAFFEKWNLTIFDECHNYCTSKKDVYRRIASTYTLGLSATPNQKKNGFGVIPIWNIGPILDVVNDVKDYMHEYTKGVDSVVFKGAIYGVQYKAPPKYSINYKDEDGVMDYRKMMQQLKDDPYRMKLIIKIITMLSERHDCVLVYSEWIEPLKLIIEEIRKDKKQIIIDKKLYDIITGGVKDSKKMAAFKKANIIYTTYRFMGEGISVPRISAILYINPRRTNTEQYNGRLIRPSNSKNDGIKKHQNSRFREIVDIIDWNVGLKNSYFARLKEYKKLAKGGDLGTEFSITKVEALWDNIQDFAI